MEKKVMVIGFVALVGLYLYAQKNKVSVSQAASMILGESPKLASQAQFARGTQSGPQASELTDWNGTFNDVPLYENW